MKKFATFLFWAASCITIGVIFSGCAGDVPLPVSSKVERGQKVTAQEVAFIQPRVTARTEVTNKLGTSYVSLPKQRAIAYSWELKGGGMIWWYVIGCAAGGIADGSYTPGGWRGYFIAFDEMGVVTRTEFESLSTRYSLHELLQAWESGAPPVKAHHREPVLLTPP